MIIWDAFNISGLKESACCRWDDDTNIFKVSAYAARVTLEGLQEGFTNAKDIMQWLADCAHEIAKDGKTVVWKTPLGLPVVQPYRKAVSVLLLPSFLGLCIKYSLKAMGNPEIIYNQHLSPQWDQSKERSTETFSSLQFCASSPSLQILQSRDKFLRELLF